MTLASSGLRYTLVLGQTRSTSGKASRLSTVWELVLTLAPEKMLLSKDLTTVMPTVAARPSRLLAFPFACSKTSVDVLLALVLLNSQVRIRLYSSQGCELYQFRSKAVPSDGEIGPRPVRPEEWPRQGLTDAYWNRHNYYNAPFRLEATEQHVHGG